MNQRDELRRSGYRAILGCLMLPVAVVVIPAVILFVVWLIWVR